MPFFKKLSWGKGKKPSSKSSVKDGKKKTVVRFDTKPQYVECDYVITEALQKKLWYLRDDLLQMQNKLYEISARVAKSSSDKYIMDDIAEEAPYSHSFRGMENHIHDRTRMMYGLPSRDDRHRYFVHGFLDIRDQQVVADAEELRDYCCATSERHQFLAFKAGSKDALAAMRIYQASENEQVQKLVAKSLLPEKTSAPEQTACPTSKRQKEAVAHKAPPVCSRAA